jgi:L-aspartate oxidase
VNVVPVETVELTQDHADSYLKIKNELSEIMSNQVGIVRNQEEMTNALTRIQEILAQYHENTNDYNVKKINALATVCSLICISALERKESRGGHVRSDFPKESHDLNHHIIQQKGQIITTEKVRTEDNHE